MSAEADQLFQLADWLEDVEEASVAGSSVIRVEHCPIRYARAFVLVRKAAALLEYLGRASLLDTALERLRQVAVGGWDAQHDDEHVNFELALAGASYAVLAAAGSRRHKGGFAHVGLLFGYAAALWPWHPSAKKQKETRANLVRAAALIIAEIDRLDRATGCRTLPNEQGSEEAEKTAANA